jgi:hypothetical protein
MKILGQLYNYTKYHNIYFNKNTIKIINCQRRKQKNGHRRLDIGSNTVGKTGQHAGSGQDGQLHRSAKTVRAIKTSLEQLYI